MIYIYPQAEPFFLQGNKDIALLFIHGFTASPSEVYPVAKLVHEMTQCSVSGLLLPGHGSNPKYLKDTTWEDWYGAVNTEVNYLRENYARVFVVGFSMGALLALHAADQIEGINGIVTINAPIYNNHPLLSVSAPVMRVVKPYFLKKGLVKLRELADQGRFAYEVIPVKAFQSMLSLRHRLVDELCEIRVPLLVIQSLKDESVNPKSADFLMEKIGAVQAKKVELEMSEHVATMGPEKDKIAAEIVAFMTRVCAENNDGIIKKKGQE
ncbi:MAG: alpha/beta fold hydrolase [Bacillota bacterium]|nr:alpha/beta fold hydrolase [Bacillota bacterium]